MARKKIIGMIMWSALYFSNLKNLISTPKKKKIGTYQPATNYKSQTFTVFFYYVVNMRNTIISPSLVK